MIAFIYMRYKLGTHMIFHSVIYSEICRFTRERFYDFSYFTLYREYLSLLQLIYYQINMLLFVY